MASTYSPNLRLELIGTGEQQGTWGTTTNTNLGTLLEEAIGGYVSVTVSNSGDTTLSTNNGSADQSRNAVINLTGTITAARNVICPAIEKLYVVKNATTGGFSVTFKVSGQTGVTIPNGETYFLYVDGIDANKIVGNVASTNATNTFTENQIISVTDNTDAALRITQLGTGNALLVEDSTNPDATPTVIAADGTVIVGHTTALSTDNYAGTQITPKVQIQGTNNQASTLSATTWSATTAGPQIALGKSRSATVGTNTVVQSGDVLGAVTFAGDDGGEIIIAASIRAESDGTPGDDDMPGRLLFSTTADGAQTATERMRINSKGNVNIGAADDPDSALQITGSTNATGVMVGSISGTTLTITAVTSGSVSVGDRLFIAASGLDYNTYVTALGTGTGGTGTYTINNTTTLASTTIYFCASSINTLSFVDTDTTELTNQPIGGIEWYGSDASTPGAGVKAYIATVAESATPDAAMLFGTSDNTASTQAVERMRITSGGNVGIGTSAPGNLLDVGGAAQATTFEVGNVSDTTISRVSAGVIAVEGDTVATLTAAQTFSGLKTFTGGIQSTANAIYNVQNANTKTVADAAIGATSAQYIGWNATGSATAVGLGNQATGTGGVFYEGYKARGGNTTTITAAASGDDILTIRGNIYDGAAWRSSARITFSVDAAVSSGDAPGAITFSTTSDGAGSVTDRFKIDSSGDCLVIGTSLLGYGTGSGSSVTQATSRTTGVTINNPVGRITLVSAAGSTTWTSFTVTNSTVGTSDLIVVNQRTGTDLYEIHVTAVAAGSFRLSFRTTGGTTTETPTFSFAVISGSIT
jgi:hypothetical protein